MNESDVTQSICKWQ